MATSDFIRMSDFDENIFQSCFALGKLAHRPAAIAREAKDFRAHIGARFRAEREDLPVTVSREAHVLNPGDFL